ncbi:hypothetical protein M2164_000142 [Streptomyces sp. SAI-208]|uniref:hypothetical protein n=1 Tax=Streptomyces sp. SAI-208 TaxID=2940550 RepID=UPI002473D2C7|nr:hypothetical protein [Streptomyces sp. SAI-208]MDH6604507.1 hypothetical protein [Streptomyces sp. SAI-208]
MSHPQQPHTSITDGFVPEYTLPDWYTRNAPPPTDAPPAVAWHSVDNPSLDLTVRCRTCAAAEVAPVTVRSHQGLLVWMRQQAIDGPFCRQCGIALVRTYTTRTLCLGWWGPLSLLYAAPAALLANGFVYRRLRRLPQPVPLPGHPPAAPGAPVLRRPRAYVALIPLAGVIWLLTAALAHLT